MKLKDKFGLTYYLVKKNGEYYLATKKINANTKEEKLHAEIKGKRNIEIFIRNNKLEKCEEIKNGK